MVPTAANNNRFLVISTSEGLAKLDKAVNIHSAPLGIVCALKDKAWRRPQDSHLMVDIDATPRMMLLAWSEGISSCWIMWFEPATVCRELFAGECGAREYPCTGLCR